jgi:hypothetical protein
VPLYMTCLHVIVYILLAWSPCLLIPHNLLSWISLFAQLHNFIRPLRGFFSGSLSNLWYFWPTHNCVFSVFFFPAVDLRWNGQWKLVNRAKTRAYLSPVIQFCWLWCSPSEKRVSYTAYWRETLIIISSAGYSRDCLFSHSWDQLADPHIRSETVRYRVVWFSDGKILIQDDGLFASN